VSVELEEQLAVVVALGHRDVGDVHAAIPHDHRARAVVAVGNHTLEIDVLDRVVLGLDGEALLLGIERRSARHRPRAQHAAHLEPQVPVHAARGVLLTHE
jgi:hypothetical protein